MFQNTHTVSQGRRKARRLIARALAGAALGTGLFTMPVLANAVITTTADSGTGSLRKAITDANSDPGNDDLTFDATALGANADFALNSALPSITSAIRFEMSGMSDVTLSQLLSIDGGGVSVFGDLLITNDIDTLNISSDLSLTDGGFTIGGGKGTTGTAQSISLTGTVALDNESTFDLRGGNAINGNIGGDAMLSGDVTADQSTIIIESGSASNGGNSGDVNLNGNVILNNESELTIGTGYGSSDSTIGEVSITGNVTLNSESTFTAEVDRADINITGDIIANGTADSAVDVSWHSGNGYDDIVTLLPDGGDVTLTGNVNAIYSSFELQAGNGGDDTGSGGSNDEGGNGGDLSVNGKITAANSAFALNAGNAGGGNDGGDGGNLTINGSVNATDESAFALNAGHGGGSGIGGNATINGNVDSTDGSVFALNAGDGGDGSIANGNGGNANITGNVTATDSIFALNAGDGGHGDDGGDGSNGGNASITGNVTATNSDFALNAGSKGEYNDASNGGDAVITGTVTANGYSDFELNSDTNDGEAKIVGDTFANDNSAFYLNANEMYYDSTKGAYIDGNATADGNGYYKLAGNSYITGNAISNEQSTFVLSYGSHIDGDAIVNDYGRISVLGGRVDGEIVVHDNGAVNVSKSYSTDTNGSVSGNVTVYDEGTVNLSDSSVGGNVTGNGNSTISAFSLNGISGDITANGNTKLLFGGAIDIGGNAIINDNTFFSADGEINVAGDASFATTAIYAPHLELEEYPYSYGQVFVDGTLQPGGATIMPWWYDQDTYYTGHSYLIANAEEIDGEFNPDVISPLPFVVEYENGHNVLLTISDDMAFDFARLPGTENQKALGRYLNGFVTKEPANTEGAISKILVHGLDNGAPLDLPGILAALNYNINNNSPDLLDEFTALTGDTFTSFGAQSYWNQQSFINSIADQLRHSNNEQSGADFALNATNVNDVSGQLHSLRQSMKASSHGLGFENGQSAPNGIWATVTKSRLNTDGDPVTGSPQWSASNLGESVGYSSGGEAFRWGVAAGHQESDLRFGNREGYGEMDGWNAGLYGAWQRKSTFLHAVLGYSNFDNDLITNGGDGDQTSSFDSHGMSAYLELGKRLGQDKSGGFTPYASLLWTHSNHDGVQTNIGEEGGQQSDPPTLTLRDGSQNTLTSALGIRYNHRFTGNDGKTNGGWLAGIAWLHQFKNTGFPVTGTYGDPLVPGAPTSFTVNGTPLASNSLQVQVGAYGRIHNSLVGFVNYRGAFSSDQKQNAVTAGLGYQF